MVFTASQNSLKAKPGKEKKQTRALILLFTCTDKTRSVISLTQTNYSLFTLA